MMQQEKFAKYLYTFASWLVVFSVAMLVWRRNYFQNFGLQVPRVKPSDVLIIIVFCIVALMFFFMPSLRKDRVRNTFVWTWSKLVLGLLGFMVVGQIWSFFVLRHTLTVIDVGQYVRLLISWLFFVLILFFGFHYQRFLRHVSYALLSSLVLIPFLFMSEETILNWLFVVAPSAYTFLGFQNNTIFNASLLLLPIVLIFALFVARASLWKYILLVPEALLLALLIWTGSRAGWLSAVLGLLAVALMRFIQTQDKKVLIKNVLVVFLLFDGAFLMLPTLPRNTALVQIFPHLRLPTHVSREVLARLSVKGLSEQDIAKGFLRLPTFFYFDTHRGVVDVNFRDGRWNIWAEYLSEIVRNPFGLGPAYPYVLQTSSTEFSKTASFQRQANAHSTWLELWLVGGFGAFILFIFFLTKIYKLSKNVLSGDGGWFSLWIYGALVAMLIDASFIDFLEARWFWVVLAIAIAYAENYHFKGRTQVGVVAGK